MFEAVSRSGCGKMWGVGLSAGRFREGMHSFSVCLLYYLCVMFE